MSKRKLSRREFLRLSALTSAAATLAACGGTEPEAESAAEESEGMAEEAPSAEGVTTSWWYAWGNLPPAIDRMVETDEFKEWMGDNTLEHKGSVETEALLAAVAAGTPPDGGSNFDYPALWSRGAVLPVNDMVETSSMVQKDDIIPALWDSCFYGSDMIGTPGIESFLWYGMNYNAKAAEDAGLDPDSPPLTWEDCYTWHEALTKFDDAGNLLQFGFDPYDAIAGEPDFAATSFGFTWWDEEARTFDLGNELMAEALDVSGNFIRLVGPDKFQGMRQVEGQGTWGAAYNAGVQNMIVEGYWHPGETQIQQPDIAQHNRATWAPVPASRAGSKIMATGAHFVQLFKEAANTAAMFKVSEFLLSPTALDIIFEEVGWLFGKLSYLETVDPNTYPGLDFYLQAPDQVTDWIIGRRCPIHWYVADQYVELREQVFRDLMSPQDAAAELQKRALDEWDAQGLE
ncbi:MAG: twin-arginine translocation signal domain-containing protein [Anaerolineales bacterium]|nr:twin-arginine translocation signal domain-containing protein [Anaerolineales bacterium]